MITSAETHTRTWEMCLRQWSVISPMLLPISSVLGELESSSNADRLLRNLLSSVSENTLTRYLANLHKFILVSEELALDLGSLKQINIADILLSLHRGEVHISNALKALRWAAKAFHLRLPDLYGGLLLGVESRVLSDRKEALPLPIFILAAWERFLLSEEGETGFRLFIGGLLVAANASLRFSDCQHVLWSSVQAGRDCLRAISYRTKSSRRGMPFGLVSCGFYGDSAAYYHSWVCKYLYLLGCEWDLITERFGETVPDALFFLSDDAEWRPMSYAQALSAFRGALVAAGLSPHEAGNYTLHSLKTSFLASLAQLQVSFKKRGLQGHHRSSANGCVLLYSRDDVHGALSLQQMFWDKVRSGWLPLTPQARGGLHPAKQIPIEPQVLSFQTSPAHSRFPFEDISALPSTTQVVPSPPAVPAPEAVEPAGDSDVNSSSSSTSSSAPSTQQARSWTKVSEQDAEEHLWVQTSSGLIHCATPHSGLEGIVVVRLDGNKIRVKPRCGTIARSMTVLADLPQNPRFCRHKACQAIFWSTCHIDFGCLAASQWRSIRDRDLYQSRPFCDPSSPASLRVHEGDGDRSQDPGQTLDVSSQNCACRGGHGACSVSPHVELTP